VTGYSDLNGDGILERNEVQFGAPLVFLGSVNPTSEISYATSIRGFAGGLRLSALIDQVNGQASTGLSQLGSGSIFTNPAFFIPTSLARQAAAWQSASSGNTSGFFGKINTIRFAELSLSGRIP